MYNVATQVCTGENSTFSCTGDIVHDEFNIDDMSPTEASTKRSSLDRTLDFVVPSKLGVSLWHHSFR